MERLLFATNNLNKLKEIQSLLGETITLLSLEEAGIREELPETQDTLEGNALQKAHRAFELCGIPCFADDTGLEVFALGGRPGVYSARYAGEQKDPEANMEKLLGELQDKPDRRARFRTVIALVDGRQEVLFEGSVEGTVTAEKRGRKGFGYDPVFLPGESERTFAEMEMAEKNRFSHRARAIQKLVAFLGKK